MLKLYDLEPFLLARCFLDMNSTRTLNNILAMGSTSKTYYLVMNSDQFLKALDPDHPYEVKGKTIKEKFWSLRNCYVLKTEVFPGIIPPFEAFVNQDCVEIVSFQNGIQSFKLNEKRDECVLVESNAMDVEVPSQDQKRHVACGDGYLAINSGLDSKIHIFTSVGKRILATFEIENEIVRLDIKESKLYSYGREQANVFDLESLSKLDSIPMAPSICIGEKYTLHSRDPLQGDVYALKLDGSTIPFTFLPRIGGIDYRYLFSNEDHFIEVLVKCNTFEVSRIKDGVKTGIDAYVPEAYESDIYFHKERIIVLDNEKDFTRFFSYDTRSRTQSELLSLPFQRCYSSTLISTAQKIYYLRLILQDKELKFHLTTLQFGKI